MKSSNFTAIDPETVKPPVVTRKWPYRRHQSVDNPLVAALSVQRSRYKRKSSVLLLAAISAVAISLASCEKYRLNKKMAELCALDGGITVYETSPQSRESLDKAIRARLRGKREDFYGPDFRLDESDTLVAGTLPTGNGDGARLMRLEQQIIRKADGKLLGKQVVYLRTGGDLITLVHPSGERCPNTRDDVATRIFMIEEK